MIEKLARLSGKSFTVFLVTFLSIAAAFDNMSPADSIYWKKIEEAVQGYCVDDLFVHHQLPHNFEEFNRAHMACLKAGSLLRDGKGEEAIPYLIFAESFYIADSLKELHRIYLAEKSFCQYRGISSATYAEIKKNFVTLLNAPNDPASPASFEAYIEYKRRLNTLYTEYDQMTRTNIAQLEERYYRTPLRVVATYLKDKARSIIKKRSRRPTVIDSQGATSQILAHPEELCLSSDKDIYSELMPMISLQEKKRL
ncbi:hypothetical protein [Candidatus Odyssella thessalonicensis]|uniref:hypothetical protein n=1 Tax=Candidatus Odyssella thessalonicensis TaxID=84647 RepID=UPI000225BD9E|nr:hypothetical protein [Candidatus Odyssella thessalonicensis]